MKPSLESAKKLHLVIEKAYPNRQIRVVEICKGTDRYRKPPVRLVPNEAPLRKYLGIHRQSQAVFESNGWEAWEKWSNRKLSEKGEPARILVTIFGRTRVEEEPRQSSVKRPGEEIDSHPHKRPHVNEELYRDIMKEPYVAQKDETSGNDQRPKEFSDRQETEEGPESQERKHHGEKFLALKKEEQQWIRKIHANLGHPGNQKMRNLLQSQGYPKHIVEAVADYKCSTCHELQQPRRARPASLTSEERESSMMLLVATLSNGLRQKVSNSSFCILSIRLPTFIKLFPYYAVMLMDCLQAFNKLGYTGPAHVVNW